MMLLASSRKSWRVPLRDWEGKGFSSAETEWLRGEFEVELSV